MKSQYILCALNIRGFYKPFFPLAALPSLTLCTHSAALGRLAREKNCNVKTSNLSRAQYTFLLSLFLVGVTTSLIAFPMDGSEESHSSTVPSLTRARARDVSADAGEGKDPALQQKRGSTFAVREDESNAAPVPNVSAAGKLSRALCFVDERQLEESEARKASFYEARKADALSEAAFFDGKDKSEISGDSSELLSEEDNYTRLTRVIMALRYNSETLTMNKVKEMLDYLNDQAVHYSPSLDDDGPWEKVLGQLESANALFSQLEKSQSEIDRQRLGFRSLESLEYSLKEDAIIKIHSAYNLVQSLDRRERYAQEASFSKNPMHTNFWNKAAEQAQVAVLYNSEAINEARTSGIKITHTACYCRAEDAISIAEQYESLVDYSKKTAQARSIEDHQIADRMEKVAEQTQIALNYKLQVKELKKTKERLLKEDFWLLDVTRVAKYRAETTLKEIDCLTRLRASSDPIIILYLNSALKIARDIEQHYAQAALLFASHDKEEADKLEKKASAAEGIIKHKYEWHVSGLERVANRNKQEAPQHDLMLADYLEKTTQACALGNHNFATLWTEAAEQTQAVMGYVSRGLEALGKGEDFIHFSDAALSATSARELVVEAIAFLTHANASTDPEIKIYWKRTLDKIKVTTDLYTEAAEAHVAQNPEEAEQLIKKAQTVASRAKEYARGKAVPPNLKKSTQSAKLVDRLAVAAAAAHSEEAYSASLLATDPSTAPQQEEATKVKKKIAFADDSEK